MRQKGMGQLDRYYLKVQQVMLDKLLFKDSELIVTDFDERSYFVTIDRAVFYVIPRTKFYLTERTYRPAREVFLKDIEYVSDLWMKQYCKVTPTGNVRNVNPNMLKDAKPLLELNDPEDGLLYIQKDELYGFPNEIVYCKAGLSEFHVKSPIFILTTLNIMIGGIWPVVG